jgi:hypothetical protein
MRNHISCLLLLLVLSVAFALPGFATSLDWQVVSPAGSSSASSAHLKLSSTVGQPGTGRSTSSHLHSQAGFWQDFSLGGGTPGCCVARVGDANMSGDDEPTISDISTMINAKFITGTCDGVLSCLTEADINRSGGVSPVCADITISDISSLIDYLFITGPSRGLPNCL